MSDRRTWSADARPLVDGRASGSALVLSEPLSFWGGLDQATGLVTDRRHPQHGSEVTARILVMPAGRGSSSSSSVLAEAIRAGNAPAAIVLREVDEIVALGALAIELLDGASRPVVVLAGPAYDRLRSGDRVTIERGGRLRVEAFTG